MISNELPSLVLKCVAAHSASKASALSNALTTFTSDGTTCSISKETRGWYLNEVGLWETREYVGERTWEKAAYNAASSSLVATPRPGQRLYGCEDCQTIINTTHIRWNAEMKVHDRPTVC